MLNGKPGELLQRGFLHAICLPITPPNTVKAMTGWVALNQQNTSLIHMECQDVALSDVKHCCVNRRKRSATI